MSVNTTSAPSAQILHQPIGGVSLGLPPIDMEANLTLIQTLKPGHNLNPET